jgi:hypothetical protein
MTIRAKMKCTSITKQGDHENVHLMAVTDDTEENKTWSKWTPNGSASLSISNPDAQGQFLPGTEYFIDFTAVPAPETKAAPAAG